MQVLLQKICSIFATVLVGLHVNIMFIYVLPSLWHNNFAGS